MCVSRGPFPESECKGRGSRDFVRSTINETRHSMITNPESISVLSTKIGLFTVPRCFAHGCDSYGYGVSATPQQTVKLTAVCGYSWFYSGHQLFFGSDIFVVQPESR